jgi:hypothetical protein
VPAAACYESGMKVKARDGKVYEVSTAPVGGTHEVKLDDELVGSFVLEPDETKVTVRSKRVTDKLLVDIADRFVDKGGGPMGIA